MSEQSPDSRYLSATYAQRFSAQELRDKQVLWETLCTHVFQEYVPSHGTVLDLGAGYCEFVNNIQAGTKIAVDLNPDTRTFANDDVDVRPLDARDLRGIGSSSVDTVFSSNFFEHLPDSRALLETLSECWRVLRSQGTVIILMPNIRNLPGAYWDYLDHHLPLTEHSLVEALELSGFRPTRVEGRFLPYTVRGSRLPVRSWSVRAYLRFRPAWRLLGKQMLVVAQRIDEFEGSATRRT